MLREIFSIFIMSNIIWSLDFMNEGLQCGIKTKNLNIIIDFNREVLTNVLERSTLDRRVIWKLA